ncbi:MAG: Gfo/Idh/MocA family oxidoreductase [Chloroflexota bacterium]|nr:Gfo/Idh/MocA family oxidoreductase [Chloroflexota bacterium]
MTLLPTDTQALTSENNRRPLRFAILGTGYWARYQLAAWREIGSAECVAPYNRTRSRAEAIAAEVGVPHVYDDPKRLLAETRLDFVDVITSVDAHAPMVRLAAAHGLPVICQKPMATSLEEAQEMVRVTEGARVPFFVHEKWRWQTPSGRCIGCSGAGR